MGRTQHTFRRRLAAATTGLALIAATVSACTDRDDDAATTTGDGAASEATIAERSGSPAPGVDDTAGAGSITAGTGFDLDAIGRDLAIELHVTMTSDDLRAAVDGVRRAATANGGGVVSSDVDYGAASADGGSPAGHATLVVKVPPAGLDAVLAGLERLGVVTSLSQAAEDVTDQLIDLGVRIRNQRESVERVRGLLESATDLDQVVRLESELTARQVELERLEAIQQALADRVALSTLTIDVVPAPAGTAGGGTDDGGIGEAFRSGWDAFVTVLFGLVFVLAVLAPFLVVAAAAALTLWLVLRRRHRVPVAAGERVEEPLSDEEPPVGATRRR